jgi:hypothetical protein
MRLSLFATLAASSLTAASFAGVVGPYATSDFQDWLSAGALPGAEDPSGSLFDPSLTTSLVVDEFNPSSMTFGPQVSGSTAYTFVSNGTSANWWSWKATGGAGGVSVSTSGDGDSIYSNPANSALSFEFNGSSSVEDGFISGLRGIGGGFRFFNADGQSVNGRIILRLSTGESIIRSFNSDEAFAGFWLTDPSSTITGLTLEPFSGSTSNYYIGAHTLFLGYAGVAVIPAPGAVALLGAAGLVGLSRRRG